jgi:hypothetical protein
MMASHEILPKSSPKRTATKEAMERGWRDFAFPRDGSKNLALTFKDQRNLLIWTHFVYPAFYSAGSSAQVSAGG